MIGYWFSLTIDSKTPKAFANSSPGLERSDNPGNKSELGIKP